MSYQNIWDYHIPTVVKGDDRKLIYTNFVNDFMLPKINENGSGHYTDQKAVDTVMALIKYGRFIKEKSPEFDAVFNVVFANSIKQGYFMQLFDSRYAPQYNFNFNNYSSYLSIDVMRAFDDYFMHMNPYGISSNMDSLAFYANITHHYGMANSANTYFEGYINNVRNTSGTIYINKIINWFYLTNDVHREMDAALIDFILRSANVDKFLTIISDMNDGRWYGNYKEKQLYKKLKYKFNIYDRINRYVPDECYLGIMI